MKRKYKLITSIVSLTAAVALLVFGVYAAATRTVDITGTVSFTAQNVAATVTVSEGLAPTAGQLSLTDVGAKAFTVGSTANQDGLDVSLNPSLTDQDLVYRYQIVVANDFTTAELHASFTVLTETTRDAALARVVTLDGVTVDPATELDDVTIAAGESVTLILTYSLDAASAPQTLTMSIGTAVKLATTSAGL